MAHSMISAMKKLLKSWTNLRNDASKVLQEIGRSKDTGIRMTTTSPHRTVVPIIFGICNRLPHATGSRLLSDFADHLHHCDTRASHHVQHSSVTGVTSLAVSAATTKCHQGGFGACRLSPVDCPHKPIAISAMFALLLTVICTACASPILIS